MIPYDSTENHISSALEAALAKLSHKQLRFVVAMQEYPSKKEAADSINVPYNTVMSWSNDVDEAIRLMAEDRVASAREARKQAVLKAVAVKIAGLDSRDENIRQKVATEILEAEFGKPRSSVALTGNEGGPIEIRNLTDDELLRNIAKYASLAAPQLADDDAPGSPND